MTSSDFDKYVWELVVVDEDGKKCEGGSGVTIENNLILTCSHILIEKCSKLLGRRVKEKPDYYSLEVAYDRPEWDIALLRLVETPKADFEIPPISQDEVVGICDRLYHIECPEGDFSVGSVVYPCKEVDPVTFKGQCDWASHISDLSICREYTIAGDLKINKYNTDVTFGRNLNPNVPLIMCHRMGVTSGGPVFRGTKELVGIAIFGGYLSGILHVSVIKEFLKDCFAKEPQHLATTDD